MGNLNFSNLMKFYFSLFIFLFVYISIDNHNHFIYSKKIEVIHKNDKTNEQLVDKDGTGLTATYQLLKILNDKPHDELQLACEAMQNSLFSPLKCVNHTLRAERESSGQLRVGQRLRKTINTKRSGPVGVLGGALKPIILVPGIAGSGLEAKLNKTKVPAFYCTKNQDWFRIWLSLPELLVQKCWFDNLAVDFDATTGKFSNTPGVEIREIDFGGILGVGYLDYKFSFPIGITNVYGEMVEFFEDLGYEVGKNIRGAPFDWRLSIQELEKRGWFDKFKSLVESTYEMNKQQKVVLVAHSMGGLLSLYFLDKIATDQWKAKYIDSFIPIAVPWSGSPKALRTVLSGDNFGIGVINKDYLKKFAQESGGVIQLIPDPIIWSKDKVFITAKNTNYTLGQTTNLFNDLGLKDTTLIYNSISSVTSEMKPGVNTHCIYGYGIKTEIYYDYNDGFDEQPKIYETDLGDGTVPLESLQFCNQWKNDPEHVGIIQVKEFDLLQHRDIIADSEVFEYIFQYIINR
ncbi:hypothetical protein DFA_11579 [Cavenderia fasciculata]|uniref:Uncharacterized protein n=1 Tax=Cavenderia fasciculata TaxID=261658 RepID=F4QDM1_CACFS|nr:uncharacterized protein DFA_11579 [Cavenderia fasciculata]EGG13818.1 hypothetical protein DFA_11579 [Cavenderia fasciculata]|eukprot:XP_004350526.1 hypothetical protein DFA_11579 [Cavenderia fasciculata]